MFFRPTLSLIAILSLPAAASAQHGGGASPPSRTPPPEAKQYDFLVGQWELDIRPKATSLAARLHGAPRLLGTWKAWRAFDGWGIEDELRIVDASGNPMSLTHTMRAYDTNARKWMQTTYDVYRGRFTNAAAEWLGAEMLVTSLSMDADGTTTMVRMRFHDITPARFKVRQDRSTDGGKSWDEGVLRIEARRVAPSAGREGK